MNALTAANSVLVPIQCEYYALEGLSQLVSTIAMVQEHLNPDLEWEGVVMTMYDARTNLSQQVVQDVQNYFQNKVKVYESMIPRNVRLGEAPSFGLPIALYDDKSKGAVAYQNLRGGVGQVTKQRLGRGLRALIPEGSGSGSAGCTGGSM